MDKEGGGSWKLDNFHGRHICIVPNLMPTKMEKKSESFARQDYIKWNCWT